MEIILEHLYQVTNFYHFYRYITHPFLQLDADQLVMTQSSPVSYKLR